jgi:hypothetical protein
VELELSTTLPVFPTPTSDIPVIGCAKVFVFLNVQVMVALLEPTVPDIDTVANNDAGEFTVRLTATDVVVPPADDVIDKVPL